MNPLIGLYDCEVPHLPCEDALARTIQTATDTVRELERELQQKRQFASDASHELRTPLTGLRTELEEARLHPGLTDLDELVRRALGNVDRMEAIITDLLFLARLEAGPPDQLQRVDLAALVRDEVARRTDRIAVRLRLEPGVTINAVAAQISRVLTNLLNNAQRHADRTVQIQVSRDGDCAQLAVVDDGDGVAEADRERIFQRFTRLEAARSRDHQGTGLGLAIAYDIVRAHFGTLRVGESAHGGARFVLRLPLAEPSSSAVA
ncbi:sensor histidine kinase [Actinomadura sp. HBU206391]|uniref:sensor histidine kinase n=1 Tax=Actinomadura sp. HBU206391 TaxID=2731692 RepID=UPI00164FD4AB|nr:HAMP domain-containing sensor histidine kinase [Actinomadura sp. HBU206391]MBC6460668.1 HAMP domain-containing histidine kinase [Actinomadura sp. HBU206391]